VRSAIAVGLRKVLHEKIGVFLVIGDHSLMVSLLELSRPIGITKTVIERIIAQKTLITQDISQRPLTAFDNFIFS
jgi:hypothetical protein